MGVVICALADEATQEVPIDEDLEDTKVRNVGPFSHSERCSYPVDFVGRGPIRYISGGDMPSPPEGPKGGRAFF